MSSIPMRCGACKSWVVWGIKNARPHPYNAIFDEKGRAHQGNSHTLTCPYAENWLPKRYKTLRARADRHTEDIQRWRASCLDSVLKYYHQIFWNGVSVHDVPEKHAIPIAWKLVERGGPFSARHPLDMLAHFGAIVVKDSLVMWVMLTDAIYNTIHWHLHGFLMSLDTGMQKRLPVAVAAEEAGRVTALIDLDPQGSAIRWSDARGEDSPVVISAHSTRLNQVLHTAEQNGADFAILDTSPYAESAALDAAKAANLALVPCRASIFDLQAVELSIQIANMAQVQTRVVFNAVPSRGDRVDQAREAVGIFNVPCAPCVIGNRVAFSDAVLQGKTVQEFDPASKASTEVRELYKYVSKEIGV